MKRTIALFACAFALTACGNQSGSDNTQSGGDNSQSGSSTSQADNAKAKAGASEQFANKKEKRSYALGMDIGNSLKDLPMDVDLDQLTQGVRDVVSGGKTKLSQKQLHTVMQGVVSDMEAAQKKQQQQKAVANLKAGQKFLAQNKTKPGVKTLKDGLQYKVIKKGDGPQPDANDSVTVDYTGKLIDGTVFDSSKKRGKPVTFPVNAVIPGWTEALQLMHAGGEYKLFIPPDLAYGERGAGSKIGPNETLIFDVKLISVQKNKGAGSSGNGNSGDSSGSSDSSNGDSGSSAGSGN
ncbi:FKBP-type peptidyl-prolyl cis-trans isomerase [Salinisphaera sp. LB1]|uniref:FKBP-type peptidyl-prolyl cis-trans isomerase n=1 Tax=Salinisphaera sp. LB1 TaxID=2183911 RepID=UPI000D7D2B47|nr:FKBP-type peptidyl-prolyl cis-trans isomerase [Salinisphaera sp. LB1]AWN14549.1 FKBP-type peptidyl-prolyl cis-trans isomerase FklB [Salinisphaera sp. LB1]